MTQDWTDLTQMAIIAAKEAYAPYSNYQVGAALLTSEGIYTGCNVENASYGATICAERTAVFKAVSEGQRQFMAIAVATKNGGSPCGLCRQVLREFSSDLTIIVTDFQGHSRIFTLAELLPESFGPENL